MSSFQRNDAPNGAQFDKKTNAKAPVSRSVRRGGAVAIMPRPNFSLSSLNDADKIDFSRWEFLIVRRSENVAAPGALCFPGGRIEPNETPAEAVRREFREEVGLEIEVGSFLVQDRTPTGAPLYWFVAETRDPESKIVVQPEEIAGFEWRTLVDLLDEPDCLANNRKILQKIVDGEIPLRRAVKDAKTDESN